MEQRVDDGLSPYRTYTRAEWAALREDMPMTLTSDEVNRLRSLHDRLDMKEVEDIYLPLSRLLSLYVAATQRLHRAQQRFLGTEDAKLPYVIGVAGSVAVGKSTTARVLEALLGRWTNVPKVDLITTDGFLFPNQVLLDRGIMNRKGFPESYDTKRLLQFLREVKGGAPDVAAPVYSHVLYDIVPDSEVVIHQPDILILEGLNVLQVGAETDEFVSDYFDFSIYIDADENHIEDWYIDRFKALRETVFKDPDSFFRNYAQLSEVEAMEIARGIWRDINGKNLLENIEPTKARASLVVQKGHDHRVTGVHLRKL